MSEAARLTVLLNDEKKKSAADLAVANTELALQNDEKGLRAREREELLKEKTALLEEREAAILALRASEADFRLLAESVPQIVWITDPAGSNIYFSENWMLYTGLTLEESLGNGWNKPFHPDDRKRAWVAWSAAITGRAVYSIECRIRRADGAYLWWLIRGAPVLDGKGAILKWFGTCTDIHELKQSADSAQKRSAELSVANAELAFQSNEKAMRAAELALANTELIFQNNEKDKRAAELTVANAELAFQNDEKEKRAVELAIANKRLTQFSFIASHELQEPLRTVANYMQLFEQDYVDKLDENALNYIQSVNEATARMSKLVKSLLDFSRLGHSTKLSVVDISSLVQTVISDLAAVVGSSNADIEVFTMPHLNVYEAEIRLVFQNLIVNALKFRKDGIRTRVEIRSDKVEAGWQFSVKDNGIGIDPVHFERIFDIFQQLHTHEEYEGTGIGLSTCKKIVESHQGTIRVESSPEQGTTLFFTIPVLAA